MTAPTTPASVPVPENPPAPESFGVGLLKSLLFSLIVVILCAIAWGVVAYFTNTIYFWAAIIIGLLVSLAATSGFRRINFGIAALMFIPCLAFALLSVILGDFIFYTLSVAKEFQLDWIQAAQAVAEGFVEVETSTEGLQSMAFGGIGALVGFIAAVRRR